MAKLKVVHYINQFFAQIGGEEKADYPAELRVGEVVGPGMALTQARHSMQDVTVLPAVPSQTQFRKSLVSRLLQVCT